MPFSIPVAGAVFLTIRFTVLFAVLPFAVRSQHETGDIAAVTDPGAPVAPRLIGKTIWSSVAVSPRWSRLPTMLADFRIY